MSRRGRKLLTVDQGQALRRRAIKLGVRKRMRATANSDTVIKRRTQPKMPRKLKKLLRQSFESTFLAAVHQKYPNAPEPRNHRMWKALWCMSWRKMYDQWLHDLHENMLEQLMLAEDRSMLKSMRAAAGDVPCPD